MRTHRGIRIRAGHYTIVFALNQSLIDVENYVHSMMFHVSL